MNWNITDYDNVEKAIISLLIKGKNPSIEAIRSELATLLGLPKGQKKGSPNEVLKQKLTWQEKLKQSQKIPTPEQMPEAVFKHFYAAWLAIRQE